MKIKGYVVRGTDQHGASVYAVDIGDGYVEPHRGVTAPYVMPFDATALASLEMESGGCTDVRIFAVAKDGTETPLPTYEQALAEIDYLRGNAEADTAVLPKILARNAALDAEVAALKAALATTHVVERIVPPGADAVRVMARVGAETSVEWRMRGADVWCRDMSVAGAEPRDPDNARLAAAHVRIATLTGDARALAMRRLSRSYSAARSCVYLDDCTREGDDIVWPDGERWPTRTEGT